MNNETVGISTIIVGVVIVIGAVRGTWKKIFDSVVLGPSDGSSSSGGNSLNPFNNNLIPNPLQPNVPGVPIKIKWCGSWPLIYPCGAGLQAGPIHVGTSYVVPQQGELIGTGPGVVIY